MSIEGPLRDLVTVNNTEGIAHGDFTFTALLIKIYPKGKLFLAQKRLFITDLNNNIIDSNDIIDLIEQIL